LAIQRARESKLFPVSVLAAYADGRAMHRIARFWDALPGFGQIFNWTMIGAGWYLVARAWRPGQAGPTGSLAGQGELTVRV